MEVGQDKRTEGNNPRERTRIGYPFTYTPRKSVKTPNRETYSMHRGPDTNSCRPAWCFKLYEFLTAFWFWGPCSPGITPSGSQSFYLPFCRVSEPWRMEFDDYNPFRLIFPRSWNLNDVWLWDFICFHLLQEKAYLMMVDQGTDPWVQQDIIWSLVITVGLFICFVLFVCSLLMSYLFYRRSLSNLVSCSWSPKYGCLWVLSCRVDLSQISIGWLLP